jgi:branched-chain amino acid transport system permease protein
MRPTAAVAARWRELDRRARSIIVVGGPVVLYLIAYVLPGVGARVAEKAPIGIVLVGVMTGSVTALLAIGLILIYRTNRFINFAYGSMGSLFGVLAIGLYIRHKWPFFLVVPLAVLAGILIGAAVEFSVIRRFQSSTRLVLTVASIGLAQVLGYMELQGSKAIDFISLTGGFKVPISFSFNVGVREMAGDEVLIILVVPVVILFLAWFLLRTDVGVAVRGAAENMDRALLLGIPVRRLSTIVWMIAGGLSTLTFVLKAPFSGITPGISNGPAVLLGALAAAVVARMESLPVAFAAGAGLGVIEQLVHWNYQTRPALVDAVFLGVVLVALFVQRSRLSRAQETGSSWSASGILKSIPGELRRLPEVRYTRAALLAIVVALFIWLPRNWSGQAQVNAGFAITWAMVGVSLVILTGWGGHISLGQFAIAGVGALVAGNLIAHANLDFFFTMLAAGAGGAAVALLVGMPALRIRGPFLAVTTLGLAIAMNSYVLNPNYYPGIMPSEVKRGFLWQRFDLSDNYVMYLTALAFLGLSILAALNVRRARRGRVVIATRDNERAAGSAAVPTTNVKLSAFLLSGVIAGMAGALNVMMLGGLYGGSFNPDMSLAVFSFAVIGGLGSLAGAVFGVLVFQWLGTVQWLGEARLAVAGGLLLFVLYFLPGGLWQVVLGVRDRLLRRVANRRGILVPSLVADQRVADADEAPVELDLLENALEEPVKAGR